MIKYAPAVFAVKNDYQIMAEVKNEVLFSVRVGEKTYFDESNGIMNSLSPVHRVSVPMNELDRAGEYTVCIRPIIERKPYYTETEEIKEFTYKFYPIPKKNIKVYHISDAHNRVEQPVIAAKTFGKIDLLILNGDIISDSGDPDKFSNIYEICSVLTQGSVPVIFSRGNHDMRGNFAEKFADYTPGFEGKTYYTFRLGSVWGILLDCGEDKLDNFDEYGHTVACHCFRERQTEYLKSVVENAKDEYAAEGIKTRLVIAHNPFTKSDSNPIFNIETDIYTEWARLLREYVKPDLMICGHTHKCAVLPVGCPEDNLGQPCTVLVGSEPQENCFIGCGILINGNEFTVTFTDSDGNTLKSEILK